MRQYYVVLHSGSPNFWSQKPFALLKLLRNPKDFCLYELYLYLLHLELKQEF